MGYLLLCGSGSRDSTSHWPTTKRGCWNLVRSRSTTGRGAEQGSPRHSTFSALHICVKKTSNGMFAPPVEIPHPYPLRRMGHA